VMALGTRKRLCDELLGGKTHGMAPGRELGRDGANLDHKAGLPRIGGRSQWWHPGRKTPSAPKLQDLPGAGRQARPGCTNTRCQCRAAAAGPLLFSAI
jgi:hypothetical protein